MRVVAWARRHLRGLQEVKQAWAQERVERQQRRAVQAENLLKREARRALRNYRPPANVRLLQHNYFASLCSHTDCDARSQLFASKIWTAWAKFAKQEKKERLAAEQAQREKEEINKRLEIAKKEREEAIARGEVVETAKFKASDGVGGAMERRRQRRASQEMESRRRSQVDAKIAHRRASLDPTGATSKTQRRRSVLAVEQGIDDNLVRQINAIANADADRREDIELAAKEAEQLRSLIRVSHATSLPVSPQARC